MGIKIILSSWKKPFLLLAGIGLSNIGDWIYLIALNLIVFNMTGSPLAVAALYILKPLSTLCTNVWAGSLVDRMNQRNMMVGLDLMRAVLIFILPSLSSLWGMYAVVFLVNMASSIFTPASMTYITKLIDPEKRKRFNSLRSLIDSGGFLIGPAIAGLLFMLGSPETAIYVNAWTFFISGMITLWLPKLNHSMEKEPFKFSRGLITKDWKVVLDFTKNSAMVMGVYFLFGLMMVMATALDSLEAAFSKEVLLLSDTSYGFLVSIAGAGIAFGAVFAAFFSQKMTTAFLLGWGSVFVSIGYIVYAFSLDFYVAAVGFFLLAFSLALANTGFHTFYQESIPVHVMGRVTSLYGLLESLLIIIATIAIGVSAQWASIKLAVIVGSFLMLLITILLRVVSYKLAKDFRYKVSEVS